MSYFGLPVFEKNSQEYNNAVLQTGGFVDVPRIISFSKARKYMGRGIEFKHEKEEIHKLWHKWVELNNFYDFMFRGCRTISEQGALFVTINTTKDKMSILGEASPCFASGVAFSFSTPTVAVINSQIAIGNVQVYCRQVYDTEKVVRRFWTKNQQSGKIEIYGDSENVEKELQLELGKYNTNDATWTYYHNLGFVPVEVIYNEPFQPNMPVLNAGFYTQSPFITQQYSDVAGFDYRQVRDIAKCGKLPTQLDNLYIHMNKLIELYKPRLLISTNNSTDGNPLFQQKMEDQNMNGNPNSNLADADIFYSTEVNKVKVDQVQTPNTIDHYQNQIVATWIDIFKACGLSFVTQSGTQKTGQESYTQYSGDIEEVNFMRNYLTAKWINVIIKSFKAMGVDLTEDRESWSFQVKKNLATDESNLIDNLVKQYQLKIKTPAQIISEIEGVDTDYAEHIVEENYKWFNEHKEETTNPEIMPPENANVSGVKAASLQGSKEKGGRPQDDKKGE